MKKKLKIKTILIVIAFAISLALIIIGNKNPYCLGFGAIFLAIACFLYAYEKVQDLNKKRLELSDEYYSYNDKDVIRRAQCEYQMKLCKKQAFRTRVVFYGFSILMVVFAFISMF